MQLDCWKFIHSPVCLNKGAKDLVCLEKQQMAVGPKTALQQDLHYCTLICTLLYPHFAITHISLQSERYRKLLTPGSGCIYAWLCKCPSLFLRYKPKISPNIITKQEENKHTYWNTCQGRGEKRRKSFMLTKTF